MNKKLINYLIKGHLPAFVAKCFKHTTPGIKLEYNWHINIICNALERIRKKEITRLIINIPPRYLKSICVSVAWPAWLLGKDPSQKIMASSYSQKLSNKHSQDCRLILSSQWYKEIFPQTIIARGENQKSKFVTNNRGFRFATSTGGTATGEGGDVLIIDDPQNPTNINSKKYREKTIEWFEQTFLSRLNCKKTGAVVLVMQRLHEEDLSGYLLKYKKDQWNKLIFPAIENEELGMVLHHKRENIDDLRRLREEMGEYNFAAQYQQNPVSLKGSMIKKEWLKYYEAQFTPKFEKIIQSWDTAIKIKAEHDYTVGITIGLYDNKYYILDVWRGKTEFPNLVSIVKEMAFKWRPGIVLIEDKASGQSLIQTLSNMLPIIAVKPKLDKISRFAAQTINFEAGKILIKENASWKLEFEQELLCFPHSSNDDQVDALSQALEYLQRHSKNLNLRVF